MLFGLGHAPPDMSCMSLSVKLSECQRKGGLEVLKMTVYNEVMWLKTFSSFTTENEQLMEEEIC